MICINYIKIIVYWKNYKVYFEGEEEEFVYCINICIIYIYLYNDRWGKIYVKDIFVKNEWKWYVVFNLFCFNEYFFFYVLLYFRVYFIFIKINVCIKFIIDVIGVLVS